MTAPHQQSRSKVPAVLIAVGAFLLLLAILLPTYLVPQLKVTPLELGTTNGGSLSTTETKPGTVLRSANFLAQRPVESKAGNPECRAASPAGEGEDGAAAATPPALPMSCFMETGVDLSSQRFAVAVEPSNKKEVTLQVTQSLFDATEEDPLKGLLSATRDRITYDRKSALPVDTASSTFEVNVAAEGLTQDSPKDPPRPFVRDGLSYKFPFDMKEGASYPYFDIQILRTQDINYVETTEVNGVTVHHLQQTIAPTNQFEAYRDLLLDADGNLSELDRATLASYRFQRQDPKVWGVNSTTHITMDRYYTNVRDLWVDPQTGKILRGAEQIHLFYAQNDEDAKQFNDQHGADAFDNPTRTAIRYDGNWDETTIERAVSENKSATDRLQLAQRTAPLVLGIVGLLVLIGGAVLLARTPGKN